MDSYEDMDMVVADETSKTTIDDIDIDNLIVIISRLPIESVLASKCVSYKWRELTSDPLFIKYHLTRTARKSHLLLLPVLRKEADFNSDYFPVLNVYNGIVRPLPNFSIPTTGYCKIKCSLNGLLCVAPPTFKADPLILANPILNEQKVLPTTEGTQKCQLTKYFVSLGCKDGTYKIVRYYRFRRRTKDCKLEILTVGNDSWIELDNSKFKNMEVVLSRFCAGIFYLTCVISNPVWSVKILAIDFTTAKIQEIPFPTPFYSDPTNYIDMVEIRSGIMTAVQRQDKILRLWDIQGNNIEALRFSAMYELNMGILWGHLFHPKILGQLGDGSFFFWHTAYKETDRTKFALFKPGVNSSIGPDWRAYTLQWPLPYSFTAMWYYPSFVRPPKQLSS